MYRDPATLEYLDRSTGQPVWCPITNTQQAATKQRMNGTALSTRQPPSSRLLSIGLFKLYTPQPERARTQALLNVVRSHRRGPDGLCLLIGFCCPFCPTCPICPVVKAERRALQLWHSFLCPFCPTCPICPRSCPSCPHSCPICPRHPSRMGRSPAQAVIRLQVSVAPVV